MFFESTLASQSDRRTTFEWDFEAAGARVDHNNGSASYIMPWDMIFEIYGYAKSISTSSVVTVGIDQSSPTPGSIGAWLITRGFNIETGALTPRHLSYIGPILIRVGAISGHQYSGNSVQWIIR